MVCLLLTSLIIPFRVENAPKHQRLLIIHTIDITMHLSVLCRSEPVKTNICYSNTSVLLLMIRLDKKNALTSILEYTKIEVNAFFYSTSTGRHLQFCQFCQFALFYIAVTFAISSG